VSSLAVRPPACAAARGGIGARGRIRASAAALVLALTVAAAGAAPASSSTMSSDASLLLKQVLATQDHGAAPFIIIDKRRARLWVLDERGRALGSTPVLLGLAVGDTTVPGVGDKPLAEVLPSERTTPAGRFGLEPGINLGGEDILWVDYDAGVSLHRVRATNAAERRLQRLATETADDNRISYGCINVPAAFYDRLIHPRFASLPAGRAAVYVLPEQLPLAKLFPFVAPAAARARFD
jgi:hypothetical protein